MRGRQSLETLNFAIWGRIARRCRSLLGTARWGAPMFVPRFALVLVGTPNRGQSRAINRGLGLESRKRRAPTDGYKALTSNNECAIRDSNPEPADYPEGVRVVARPSP